MNYEEKTSYLNCLSALDIKIDALIKEKEKWYKRALSLKADGTDVDGSKALLQKVADYETQINNSIDSLIDTRQEIMNAIDRINNPKYRQILYLKYINGMNYTEIGEKLGYCSRQIGRLHKKAIEILPFK